MFEAPGAQVTCKRKNKKETKTEKLREKKEKNNEKKQPHINV